MSTLREDYQRLAGMSVEELRKIWEESRLLDVEMAWGGKNMGHETIQKRFYCWRKGVFTKQEV